MAAFIQKPKPTLPFAITNEQLSKYPFSDTPVTVSRMAENINSLIDTENMKPLSYKDITQWLMNLKLLQEEISHDGKKSNVPQKKPVHLAFLLRKDKDAIRYTM